MAELRALIFDVDGTLADTEAVHLTAFNRAFADFALDWHWSEALYVQLLKVTGGKERIRYFIEGWHPALPAEGVTDDWIKSLHGRKTEIYTELAREPGIPLRTGVLRLIRESREAGLRLAIATTTTLQNVEALFDASFPSGALDWFEVVAAGDQVSAKKPAPDIYQLAMRQLGLGPDACAALEDSGNGVRSALGADLRTLVVSASPFTAGEDFTGAALILDSFGELHKPARVLGGGHPLQLTQLGPAELSILHRQVWHG